MIIQKCEILYTVEGGVCHAVVEQSFSHGWKIERRSSGSSLKKFAATKLDGNKHGCLAYCGGLEDRASCS